MNVASCRSPDPHRYKTFAVHSPLSSVLRESLPPTNKNGVSDRKAPQRAREVHIRCPLRLLVLRYNNHMQNALASGKFLLSLE
jgi:hypothetical protein